ncbi:MAG: FtsX-like permease family protein [Gallionella sp.]|nr:FtsX-like permease family protein [Gallionella sp.]
MNLLRLSFNLLRRDWRAGEWRVLMLALVLAVGSLSTVGLFADRVRQALQQQATSLLGADLRITSTRPFPASYRQMAAARGLRVVESRTFPSMVSHDGQVLLCEIQSVESGYPLRGNIEIDPPSPQSSDGTTSQSTKPPSGQVAGYPASERGGEREVGQAGILSKDKNSQNQSSIPLRGTVWADARLMRRFDLRVGDEVGIGAQRFKIAARVVKDVDQSIGFASFAPRVLMNEADVAGTGLLQEGSRISYRLMIAGEASQVSALRASLKLNANEKLEDVTDARPEIRTALERAEHFLGLAALATAILAGAAMALAARRYVARHLDGCAVMRCLGAQQGQMLRLFLYQFLLAGGLAVLGGLLLGYVTQTVLVEGVMPDASLPQPGVLPALKAAVSGFALLLGFAFLPLLQLRRVSPLRVIRRELGLPAASGWLIYGAAVLALSALFLWQAGSLRLGIAVLGGLLAGMLVAGSLAWLLLLGLARYSRYFGSHWRHAFNNLARHGRSVAVQVVALSLGGMALLVLTLVRGDLLASWQGKFPADTPNRFVVSIQPDQYQPVLDFFARQKMPQPQLLPMVKGRLVAINGQTINGESYPDPRARGLVEREFNLSYADKLPEWNELVSGKWWGGKQDSGLRNQDSANSGQLSVEEGIAKTLGIHPGDELTYDVAGSRFSATVTNLRRVHWDSMRVNFFVIATPGLLKDYPASYLASFYLPPDNVRAGDELTREFPNLLVIDTAAVIAQVRGIIERVSQTVGVVFLFTLMCGVVVLYAALLATMDERVHEVAILRTLGADSAYLRRLYLSEFAVVGALSGLFAAASAALLAWLLSRYVLEIPYRSNSLVWLAGVSGGVVMVMLVGWLTTRRLSKTSPLSVLRGE